MSVSSNLRLGLAQTTSAPSVNENLSDIAAALQQFRADQADLAIFPEYCLCLAGMDSTRKAAKTDLDWSTLLSQMCRDAQQASVFGGVPVLSDCAHTPRHLYNRTYAIDNQGNILARYDKRRLFTLRGTHPKAIYEPELFLPGQDHAITFNLHGWKIGLTTCFDLRFPEIFQQCAPCDLLICTAAFTARTGLAHWEVLLRARAIENLTWIAGVGQGGSNQETELPLHGHTSVYDPWGLPIAVAPHRERQCFTVAIQHQRLQQCRAALGTQSSWKNIP